MSRTAYLAFAAIATLPVTTLGIAGGASAVAQAVAPEVARINFRYCKFHDLPTGSDYLGVVLGDACDPPSDDGQVSYTTCTGKQLMVPRGKLRPSEVTCAGARETLGEMTTLAIVGKVQFVSADGQSVSISYPTKAGGSTINVPASFIGGQAKKGSEIVVLPTTGGQNKEALAKEFSRFKSLLDAGTFANGKDAKGKDVGLQLQVKR